jgi:hypothetical protein
MSPPTSAAPEPRTPTAEPPVPAAANEEPIVIPPLIVEATDTFIRDLPSLLQSHPGQWVAYSGSRRIGFGKDDLSLDRRCRDLGLGEGEYMLFVVEPGADVQLRGPLYWPYFNPL